MADGEALTFERLAIRRMHGFRPPGLEIEDFCAGVNIVYGPNASGKSTMAKALYRLIWPESGSDGEHVTGLFDLDGSRWRVELDAGRVVHQRDGRDASPPDVPPEDRNGRYHLYLHELLHETDREFAKAIQKAARGGYDVSAAADALDFTEPAPRSGESTHRVEELDDRVDELRRQQKALRDDERHLEELREGLDEARDARRRLDLLEDLREHAASRDAAREAERRLEAFPDVIEEVEGDEDERVDGLDEEIDALETAIRDAEREKERAAETLDASAIPQEGLPGGLLESLEERLRELRDLERRIESLEEDLAGARDAAVDEWERLDGTVDRAAAEELDLADLGDLATFARKSQQTDAREAFLERLEEAFGDAAPPSDADIDTLRDGIRHLQRWRGLGEPEEADRPTWPRRAVVAAAVLLVVVGTPAGVALHPGWLGLVALGGLLAFAAYAMLRGDASERRRSDHRREFEKLDLEGPEDWDEESVERRVDELTRRLADRRLEGQRADIWNEHRRESREIAERRDELESRRDELADRTGLAPDTEPAAFVAFVQGLRDWQEARRTVSECEARLEKKRGRRDETLEALRADLEPYSEAVPEDLPELEGRVQSLRDELEAFREAERRHRSAREELEARRDELDAVRSERDELFEAFDLEPGDRAGLVDLCRQREQYEEARSTYRTRVSRARESRDRLEERDDVDSELLDRTVADLDEEITDLERRADQFEELHEEATRLEEKLNQARTSHELEEALAEYRSARDELRRERESDYRRAVGVALAEYVREQTRDRQLPEVFHRARELLSEITRGRYGLVFDGGDPPTFRANDEVLERSFGLEELSEGTRVQLLLAVRIAFLQTREDDLQLPVVLDETLATTDDDRAVALIRSIARIASRGRQIFYLTAQADEVAKWRAHLDGEDVPHRILKIEEADRDDAADVDIWRPDVESPVPAELGGAPKPEGRSLEEYGELLDVPEWSPREPTGAVHLWYLVDDPTLLHDCLDAGVARWGQLRHLAEHGGLEALGVGDESFRAIRARAEALETYRNAWSIGRGDPVDRETLEASGAVTDNFIDEVATLCERVDGDAGELVQGLDDGEVSGFRTRKREELEEYFRREGYLTDEDPLSREQLWERVLAAAAEPLDAGTIEPADLAALFERLTGERPEDASTR